MSQNKSRPVGYSEWKAILHLAKSEDWSNDGALGWEEYLLRGFPVRQSAKWNKKEEFDLIQAFLAGSTESNLAKAHQRSMGGIRSRITHLMRRNKIVTKTEQLNICINDRTSDSLLGEILSQHIPLVKALKAMVDTFNPQLDTDSARRQARLLLAQNQWVFDEDTQTQMAAWRQAVIDEQTVRGFEEWKNGRS